MNKLYIKNNIGPNALPCEIPVLMSKSEEEKPLQQTICLMF